jgi:cytochrome c biogenesis protein CcmG, thiol:disulfide interchange protein DsbE
MSHKSLVLALAAAVIISGVNGCGSKTPTAPSPTKKPGFDIAVQDLDGKAVKVSDHLGKVVLVNFWAIWCGPCRSEMPDLDAVYRQYRDQGLVVLAVNVSEESSAIKSYAEQQGLILPMFRDVGNAAGKALKIDALPTTFFVDREGQLRRKTVGAMRKTFMVEQVEALLK